MPLTPGQQQELNNLKQSRATLIRDYGQANYDAAYASTFEPRIAELERLASRSPSPQPLISRDPNLAKQRQAAQGHLATIESSEQKMQESVEDAEYNRELNSFSAEVATAIQTVLGGIKLVKNPTGEGSQYILALVDEPEDEAIIGAATYVLVGTTLEAAGKSLDKTGYLNEKILNRPISKKLHQKLTEVLTKVVEAGKIKYPRLFVKGSPLATNTSKFVYTYVSSILTATEEYLITGDATEAIIIGGGYAAADLGGKFIGRQLAKTAICRGLGVAGTYVGGFIGLGGGPAAPATAPAGAVAGGALASIICEVVGSVIMTEVYNRVIREPLREGTLLLKEDVQDKIREYEETRRIRAEKEALAAARGREQIRQAQLVNPAPASSTRVANRNLSRAQEYQLQQQRTDRALVNLRQSAVSFRYNIAEVENDDAWARRVTESIRNPPLPPPRSVVLLPSAPNNAPQQR